MIITVDTGARCPMHEASIPLNGTVNVTIDWGDGTFGTYTSPTVATHTWATLGIHSLGITGTLTWLGSLPATTTSSCITQVSNWGTTGLTSLAGAFANDTELQSVYYLLPSTVTSLRETFYGATTYNGQIALTWNTSNVTDMASMFRRDFVFNRNVSGWDTSKVTDMRYMFSEDHAFNYPVASWDTSKVTDMRFMFNGDHAFNRGVARWNTANVTNMYGMFENASSFNRNLSQWNLSKIAPSTTVDGGADSMGAMLDHTGMSSASYGTALVGWASHAEPTGIRLGAEGLTYPSSATAARFTLIHTDHWKIADAGQGAA